MHNGMLSLAIPLCGAPTAVCDCGGMMFTRSGEISLCAGGQHQVQRKHAFRSNPGLKVNKEFNWPSGVNFSGGLYQRSASVLFPFLVLCTLSLLWLSLKSPCLTIFMGA